MAKNILDFLATEQVRFVQDQIESYTPERVAGLICAEADGPFDPVEVSQRLGISRRTLYEALIFLFQAHEKESP